MKHMLRALALAGILGIGAAAAQAQVGVFVGVRRPPIVVAAVPPCPGLVYVWTPAYYAGAVFVPGRWIYRRGYDRAYAVRDSRHDFRSDHRFAGHGRR
jgi:hypothetical protein